MAIRPMSRFSSKVSTGPRSVQELQEALSADQPTVSQQLAVLRTKNVVVTRKQGTVVNYDLRDPAIARRAIKFFDLRALFDLPAKGVFAPAGADH